MRINKAPGPDGITTEKTEAIDDFGIEKVKKLESEIYDTGQIPEDVSKSICIMIPKKPGATDCELHRTVSLMSHITKLMLRAIMKKPKKNRRVCFLHYTKDFDREQYEKIIELL